VDKMIKKLDQKGKNTFKMWAEGASIGDRLRWLLECRQMKQTELAETIGVTQAAVSNIVTTSSRKPSAPTLLRMAAALQASADWIMTGRGDPFEINIVNAESEKDLIETFRKMPHQAQAALIAAAKAMTTRPHEGE
jgi:transcriptional regulator with XRE-family HTH domain